MAGLEDLRKNWLRPFFFYGNNRISLIGGALTSASALVLIGFWVVDIFGHGGSANPYLGIIFDLVLPGVFIFGLVLIPLGMLLRQRQLKTAGQVPSIYPEIDLRDPVFRHGIDFVIVATFINFVIVGTATYRGVAYMDTPNFCGRTCHVMAPEASAYPVSNHAGVACTECHIAPGIPGFVHAKVNGTKQLMMVMSHNYPTPIMADDKLPAAKFTCLNCHNPARYIGDKLLVKTSYGDDEKNSMTRSLILLHVGGRDNFSRLSGIHGAHMGHIEYIATDSTHQTIPWVGKTNDDGSVTEFVSTDAKGPITGKKRVMDCIDCHNRAAHSFDTPEEVLNRDMSQGSPSASLPFIHKQGLLLLKADYKSQEDAASKIGSGLESFYRSQYPAIWNGQRAQIDQAAKTLSVIYSRNVFPFMKVTWGSHPDNIGHNNYPGCFRCHDGGHNAKGGKSITNDCSTCHNLIATDEPNPKQMADLGLQ
ncbi:nitrate/TMAO reductase-like tetraheme cytochrome c subunit [Silvibacterium bohemicum]|uniref:Nitrate/TMAO reductase-like tetraheme cytochrome c subunit n=1 Tax=Silvibacterium bohemicum TaxID=1577686 RepID=A0A841JX15_9BACT|nr:NapC/NirT family cytochrome c [Silvibacterium bohemicum]MBB6143531.1 nitrate/TMAO reductase-like tetraheme cytochrome c subunit [Silvibacterium bohemicum]